MTNFKFERTASGYCGGCGTVALLWLRGGQYLCYACTNNEPFPRYQAWFSWDEPAAKPASQPVRKTIPDTKPTITRPPRGNYVIRPGTRGATFEAHYDNGDVVVSYQRDEAACRLMLDDRTLAMHPPIWRHP